MAVVAAQTFETPEATLVVWPALDAVDTGAPVDLSQYNRVVVSATGTFDSETLTFQANNVTDTSVSYGALTDITGAAGTMTADEQFELNWAGNKFLRPNLSDAGGTCAVTVVAMGLYC